MALIYQTYTWPTPDTQAVSHTQDVVADGSLILNGNLTDLLVPNLVSFIKHGFIRGVSISSVNDLSASTFTVSGTQNGANISEDIGGPNNNTVYGLVSFDVITSITVDQNSAGVQIGTGDIGYLPIIQVNTAGNFPILNYGLHAVPDGTTYEIFRTFFKLYQNGETLQDQQTRGCWYDRGDGVKAVPFIYDSQSISMANLLLIQIVSTTSPIGALSVVYMQTS